MSRSIFAPLCLLLLTAGCATTGVGKIMNDNPAATGSLAVAGPMFGEKTLTPAACRSGEHEVFLGADFQDPAQSLTARVVIDPLGDAAIRLFDPADRFKKTLVLRRESCATFKFAFDRQGWQLNDIYVLKVSLELDCSLPGGDTVKGSLAAESCW